MLAPVFIAGAIIFPDLINNLPQRGGSKQIGVVKSAEKPLKRLRRSFASQHRAKARC
jgi:hypothetical protein